MSACRSSGSSAKKAERWARRRSNRRSTPSPYLPARASSRIFFSELANGLEVLAELGALVVGALAGVVGLERGVEGRGRLLDVRRRRRAGGGEPDAGGEGTDERDGQDADAQAMADEVRQGS
jgi:hypothetical protein